MQGLRWVQTRRGRKILSALATMRELLKLAQRANCSSDEARQRRAAGYASYCQTHGWFRGSRCVPCKCARARMRRADAAARRKDAA